MKKLITVALASMLIGCMAGMPNNIRQTESTFDGSTELSMEPGLVYGSTDTFSGSAIQLGLFWNTKLKDKIVITATVSGLERIENNNSLLFNIDGEITSLSAANSLTDYEISTTGGIISDTSSKRFLTTRTFIEKLLSSQSVKVRLNLAGTYADGDFTADKASAAIRGFHSFMQRVDATKQNI